MNFEKFTVKFQQALADAQSLAIGRDHNFIETVHLLIALLNQEGGITPNLFQKIGCNINQLRLSLNQILDNLPKVTGNGAAGQVHISNELNRLFNLTDKLAQQHKDQFISS